MSVIGIISMKGGVGKTSTAANLAAALGAKLGVNRVCAIDLDPQDALHWHFGLLGREGSGVCEQTLQGGDLQAAMTQTEFQVSCLPYGNVTEADREAFETILSQSDNQIGDQIRQFASDHNPVVLLDSPPGPSVYLKQVFACADLVLVVLLADAGSYATIPAMETWLDDLSNARPGVKAFYVLNQVDRSEALNRDTAAFLHQQLKPRMCPIDIHNDEAVAEALAFQQPVTRYAPDGQASHDFSRLATWVINTLNK